MAEPVYRSVGNSRTTPQPTGKTIPVLPPRDNAYLCSHMCRCNCNAIESPKGWKLKQRCVTLGIRNDARAALQVWRYKAEVGYNMTQSPPAPIMSAVLRNQPFQFPLSVLDLLPEEVVAAFDKAVLIGRAGKGKLRIPDVVIVKDMHDFDLNQPNIDWVVEIKFKGDRPRERQLQDYGKIAGGDDRVVLLEQKECNCSSCDDEAKQPAKSKVPLFLVAPDITSLLPRMRPRPVPMEEELENGENNIGGVGMARGPDGWSMYVLPGVNSANSMAP